MTRDQPSAEVRGLMQMGRFDRQDGNDDHPVYRLRWIDKVDEVEEKDLTEDETRRLEFTRFLILQGKLKEWFETPPG